MDENNQSYGGFNDISKLDDETLKKISMEYNKLDIQDDKQSNHTPQQNTNILGDFLAYESVSLKKAEKEIASRKNSAIAIDSGINSFE